MNQEFDVAVIGGGPAGLNGALMLGRSRRTVVVIDSGEPRNAPADAVHGLFARDGTPPQELLAAGRAEVTRYGGELVDATVAAVAKDGDRFRLGLADGRELTARRLLLTTGLVDQLPDVPGVRELWGSQVIHCPYCHGYEARDRKIGVIASGPMATHQALLFSQLSDDVVLFSHTMPPSDEQREELAILGITVVEREVAALVIEDGRLTGARLDDGTIVEREVVVVQPRFVARSQMVEALGIEVVEQPDIGLRIATDATGRTNIPGVWAAGNVADWSAQVGGAAAAGASAGAQINYELVEDLVRSRLAAASE